MRLIDETFLDYPYYSSRQITRHVYQLGHQVGQNWVVRLMRRMGLHAASRAPGMLLSTKVVVPPDER